MPATEAQKRASAKHNKTKDCITLRPSKAHGKKIREAASNAGESLSGYILQAVDDRMERDRDV